MLRTSPPPLSSSKLFYVEPKEPDEVSNKSIVDAKDSGIDISLVLNKSPNSSVNGFASQDSSELNHTSTVTKLVSLLYIYHSSLS